MKNMIIMRQPSHTSSSAVMSALQDQLLEGFIFSVALTVIFKLIKKIYTPRNKVVQLEMHQAAFCICNTDLLAG